MRHLLSIEDLDRAAIERMLDRAKSFTDVSEREIKKVPALRGRRVLNLFYEASTRTRSSYVPPPLVDAMLHGGAYITIATRRHPLGVARGQIEVLP